MNIDAQQAIQILISFITTQNENWSMSSIPFMLLFMVFMMGYLLFSGRIRSVYVVLFSLFFAFKANGTLMWLLPANALLSWFFTRRMMLLERGRPRIFGLAAVIIIELLPLLYFKYTNFFLAILGDILETNFAFHSLILPVGISFYTFQTISYTVDVYKHRLPADVSLLDYIFYATFFPLIIAGPITRAEVILPQINNSRPTDSYLPYTGLWLIICGIIKKVIVADYLVQYNNWIFTDPTAYSGFENLMGVLGYTMQIYFDFAGYSDFAIGTAALMGISLPTNFSFPYQSLNLTEFWHRWHISLSKWFRDYLYIPLGGNRCGNIRTYLNSFVVMLIAGLWHGASGMFFLWGVLHGVGLVAHKFFLRHGLSRIPDILPIRIASLLVTFTYVAFAWIFFRAPNLDTALAIINNIGHNLNLGDALPFLHARPLWLLMLLLGLQFHTIREHDYDWLRHSFISSHWIMKLMLTALVIQLAINISQDNIQPFIYTAF